MIKENNYTNPISNLLPLEYIIKKIENLDWIYILKEKQIDFQQKTNSKYDEIDNPFWFPLFLKDEVKLP